MIKVETNAADVAANLSKYPVEAKNAVNVALRKSADRIEAEMEIYPPPLPKQQYERTGRLGRGWRPGGNQEAFVDYGRTVKYIIINPVEYVYYVQDDRGQARIHRGRWETTKSVTDRLQPEIEELFLTEFQNVLQKILP